MPAIKYVDLMTEVQTARHAQSHERGEIEFKDGSAGIAIDKYIETSALSRLEKLDIDLPDKRRQLIADLKIAYQTSIRSTPLSDQQSIGEDEALKFATEDAATIDRVINKLLPQKKRDRSTLGDIVDAVVGALAPSFGENQERYVFSEQKPAPHRSDLTIAMLLDRVPGLDNSDNVKSKSDNLKSGFVGVPKKEGGTVQDNEANILVEEAHRVIGAQLDQMVGKKLG